MRRLCLKALAMWLTPTYLNPPVTVVAGEPCNLGFQLIFTPRVGPQEVVVQERVRDGSRGEATAVGATGADSTGEGEGEGGGGGGQREAREGDG